MNSNKADKTKVIRVFEAFAGIGAQHKAITNINKEIGNKFKIIKISEWDARAVIAYSLIHYSYNIDKILRKNKITNEKLLNEYLCKNTFSLNSKSFANMLRKEVHFKKRLISANIITNNIPNIKDVRGLDIKEIDLITYSFPCQGLSIANMGRGEGIKKGSKSTSNLIWEISRILDDAKKSKQELPKYLLMENVPALLSKKHKDDYDRWTKMLFKKFGYTTFTSVLDSNEYGMVQIRKRVFAISILNANSKINKTWIDETLNKFKRHLTKKEAINQIKSIIKINTKSKKLIEEFEECVPNMTNSRMKMAKFNKDLTNIDYETLNTLTTKQDRHPNIGMIYFRSDRENKLNKRFITPRECYQIMGFDSNDFDKVRDEWLVSQTLTKESLYRQAGNTIPVKVLEAVFKTINLIEEHSND